MKINQEQMDELERDEINEFIEKFKLFLRTETPKSVESMDDKAIHYFVTQCIEFGREHGIGQKKHFVRLALSFLKMKVDFLNKYPPNWVTEPRKEGKYPDDDQWVDYVRDGSRANLASVSSE
jgi:hypothetical protein